MIRSIAFVAIALSALVSVAADLDPRILEIRGATMGTQYSIKIFDPPAFDDDVRFEIDAELRRVNDQMSTYLKSSEVSRFNVSTSTDWFDVSEQTAQVVAFAQQVAKQTDGAFDVTVGPLVDAWSFGAAPRDQQVPSDERLAEIRKSVGFENLSVRSHPPALRKSLPDLQVDLSALAKGHGVDRVVERLASLGVENMFVEIGGEVRTRGDKAGQPWRVGIQLPDAVRDVVMIGHPMGVGPDADRSLATSGDYRNYFVVDGKRYSHTIDPRTGQPIVHSLASVSVLAADCMTADAWATAINVLGPDQGLALAEREGLDALLVTRAGDRLALLGSGALAQYAAQPGPSEASEDDSHGVTPGGDAAEQANHPLVLPLLTTAAFAILLSAMAVGVMFGRRAIRGSCGGLAGTKDEHGNVACGLCSNPADACRELREKMN